MNVPFATATSALLSGSITSGLTPANVSEKKFSYFVDSITDKVNSSFISSSLSIEARVPGGLILWKKVLGCDSLGPSPITY